MGDCKKRGYHGNLHTREGHWKCGDCGATDFCSLCGVTAKNLVTDLYGMDREQICHECLVREKPISDYLEKNRVEIDDRDYVYSLLERRIEDEATKIRIANLEAQLLETQQALSKREASVGNWIDVAYWFNDQRNRINKENAEQEELYKNAITLAETFYDKLHGERAEALKRETAHEARIEELEKLITNMFVYANEQYKKEAFIDADTGDHYTVNRAYWQGRKDGLRAIRAEIKGRNFEALDQAETYTSLEEQEDAG